LGAPPPPPPTGGARPGGGGGGGGSTEWIQYDFAAPRRISRVEVYWFDDSKIGGQCRAPASWRLLARQGSDWKEVASGDGCGVALDCFNGVSITPIETTSLRIEAKLQENVSAGVLEWRIE
jgi:hypothetical protein